MTSYRSGQYLIAVVGDQLEQVERLGGLLELEVELPGQARLVVADVAPGQPAEEHVVVLHLVVLDEQEGLLGVLEGAAGRLRLAVVEVEGVVAVEVALDGVEVDKDVVEVADEEEVGGHALAAGDGVAVAGGAAHQLEVLLRHLQVLLGVGLLAHGSVDHALEDVLVGLRRVHVLHELVRLADVALLQVVDDQVEARLGDHVHERRQRLQGALAVLEHHQVVPEQVLGEREGQRGRLQQVLQLHLGRLAVVQPVVVARLQVDADRRVRVVLQVDGEHLLRDVVVVELVVAEGHVDVERQVLPVLEQVALVDVDGLLVVVAHVVHGGERELVGQHVLQLLVQAHELVLLVELVGHVEEDADLQGRLGPLQRHLLGVLVHAEHEEAAGEVGEDLGGRLVLGQDGLVLLLGARHVAHVEGAEADPELGVGQGLAAVAQELEERDGA